MGDIIRNNVVNPSLRPRIIRDILPTTTARRDHPRRRRARTTDLDRDRTTIMAAGPASAVAAFSTVHPEERRIASIVLLRRSISSSSTDDTEHPRRLSPLTGELEVLHIAIARRPRFFSPREVRGRSLRVIRRTRWRTRHFRAGAQPRPSLPP